MQGAHEHLNYAIIDLLPRQGLFIIENKLSRGFEKSASLAKSRNLIC